LPVVAEVVARILFHPAIGWDQKITAAALPGTELLDGDFLELAGELEIEGTVFFSIAVPSDSRHFDFDPTIALVRLV
jgi:hypothetical protein